MHGSTDVDIGKLKTWIGREERVRDVAASGPLEGLAALLDHHAPPWREGAVPPLGHWLYFLPRARQSALGEDGHPRRGGFLPPVPLPRRMWAGGDVSFHRPIPLGAALERVSTVEDVTARTGASGEMVFVTVRHTISADGERRSRSGRTSSIADPRRRAAPPPQRMARRASLTSAASISPARSPCSVSRPSPSTATASTLTGIMRAARKAIRGWSSKGRSSRPC